MIEIYNGRKITATQCKVDGFRSVRVRINGQYHYTYGPTNSASLRTPEGVIAQIKHEIDAVDAYTDDYDRPRFAWYWYHKDDPRRAVALERG